MIGVSNVNVVDVLSLTPLGVKDRIEETQRMSVTVKKNITIGKGLV